MQTTETVFERELTKLINARITDLKDEISGGMLETLELYKSKAGMVEGLKAAIELMPKARENAEQRNR